MPFEFMKDPRWLDLDDETKRKALDITFGDLVGADDRWEGLSSRDQQSAKAIYLQDAEEYERSLIPSTEHGFVGEIAAGLGRGLLHVAATPANLADVAGEAVGWEGLEKAGEWGAEKAERFIEKTPGLRKSASISGDIRKNPQLWTDPNWYASIVSEGIPTVFSMLIPGLGAAKGAQALGWGVKGIRAARISGGLGAAMGLEAGGAAEQARQYEKAGEVIPIGKKLQAVIGTGVVAGALEYVPIFTIFGKIGGRTLVKRILTAMATEGGTEGAQEVVANAFAKVGYDANLDMTQGIIESVVGGILIGGGMGSISGSVSTFQEQIEASNTPKNIERISRTIEKGEKETLSNIVGRGLSSGEFNGQIFTPDHALSLIKQGRRDNIFNDADINQFKEKYPELRESLEGKPAATVADIGKATTGDEAITAFQEATASAEDVYGAARKRVGLLTPQDQAEKEFEAYQPVAPWQVMTDEEGASAMVRPGQGLLQSKPKTEPTSIFELQEGVKRRQAEDIAKERELALQRKALPQGQGFDFTDVKPKTRLRKAPEVYPEGAEYVAGREAPEGLEVDYKPVLTKKEKPWKNKENAFRALKSKRLASKGITPETHEVVPVEGGFGITRKIEFSKEAKLRGISEKAKAETPTMLKESDKVNDVTLGTLVDMASEDPAKALEHAADATVSKAKLIEGLKNKGLKAMGEAKSKEDRAEIKKNLEETLRGIEEGKKPKEPVAETPAKEPWEMAQSDWIDRHTKSPGMHGEHIRIALKSGKLTPENYIKLHGKDYGPLAEFMPEVVEKPKPEVTPKPKKEKVILFDDLDERAKGAIASGAMGKGQDVKEFINSEWIHRTVDIESLKDKNKSVWSDSFVYRKAETKGPLIVAVDGEVLDGNNRLREAIERKDKQIDILKRIEGSKPKVATKESLSETKSRLLSNIKSEKGSSELINDLSRLGADAIKRGHKSFKAFSAEMKIVLGDAWAKVKHLIRRAYRQAKLMLANERGLIGGVKAEGVPTGQLAKAQEMLAEGRDKNEVWRETGWMKGVEKKDTWKFEIDDSGAKWKPGFTADVKTRFRKTLKLKDVFIHPTLYKAYPSLKDVKLKIEKLPHGNNGIYNTATNTITINSTQAVDVKDEGDIQHATRTILLHEIQHAIQEIEGFARGGSPQGAIRVKRDLDLAKERLKNSSEFIEYGKQLDILFAMKDLSDSEVNDRIKQLEKDAPLKLKQLWKMPRYEGIAPLEIYKRLAGEIEARDTAARAKLTPMQRREQMPYEDQGIPQDQWIVTDGKGASFSVEVPSPKTLKSERGAVEIGKEQNEKLVQDLNNQLAEQLGREWKNAYRTTEEVPKSVREIIQAFEATFKTRVVAISPTKKEFSRIGGQTFKGTLYVDTHATKGFLQLAGHELLHKIKQEQPDLYNSFIPAARNVYTRIEEFKETLAETLLPGEGAHLPNLEEELVADFTGDALADPKFLKLMAREDPNVFKKFIRAVISWLEDVSSKLSKEGFGSSKYFKDVDGLRKYLDVMLYDFAKRDDVSTIDNTTPPKFSRIKETEDLDVWAKSVIADLEKDISIDKRVKQGIGDAKKIDNDPTSPEGFNLPIEGRGRQVFDLLQFKLQDRLNSLYKVQEVIKKQKIIELPDDTNAYQVEELYHGKVSRRVEDFDSKHVDPLAGAIDGAGFDLEDVEEYLYARHAPEANQRLKEINPKREDNKALSGMTNEEASKVMAKHENNKAMADIAKRVDAITKESRNILVNEGLATSEEIDAWEQLYKNYVPLKREGKGLFLPKKGMGMDIRGPESKRRLTGSSERKAVNVLSNILAQHEATIIRAEKVKVGRAMFSLAKEHKSDLWKVDAPELKPFLKQRKVDASEVDSLTGLPVSLSEVVFGRDILYKFNDNIFVIKIEGKEHTITFNEENVHAMRIVKSLKNLGANSGGTLVNIFSSVNRFLAIVNTSANPEFILSNFARDIQTAGYNINDTQAKNLKSKIFKDVFKALQGIRQGIKGKYDTEWAKNYKEFAEAGAQTGWVDHYKNIEVREKALKRKLKALKGGGIEPVRKAMSSLFRLISDENTAVENAIRLTTYTHLRNIGLSRNKSASVAKNLTVNFNRKGDIGQTLNAFYLFFNANMQGSVRLIYAATRSPKVRKMMLGTVAFATMLDILNRAIGGDDDDGEKKYDKIPTWTKEKNLILMRPNGDYFKIPLPWGYNTLHVLGQIIGESVDPNKKEFSAIESAGRMAGAVLNSFNPLGSENSILQIISPTLVDPFVQWAENKNFAGIPLKPEQIPFDVPKPEYQMHWSGARRPSKWLTKRLNDISGGDEIHPGAIDISPEVFDLFLDTLTGGAGKFIGNTIDLPETLAKKDVDVRRIPFVRRVYGEPSEYWTRTKFYDNLNEIRYAEKAEDHFIKIKDYRNLAKTRAKYRQLLNLKTRAKNECRIIKQHRDRRREIETNLALSKDIREKRIDEINQKIKNKMDRFNLFYNKRR